MNRSPAKADQQAVVRLPLGAEAIGTDGWPKLTANAKTAGGTFGKGVSARLVVEACYRRAAMETERWAMTPDAMRDEERRRRALWDMVHGPLDAATVASGGEAPAEGDAIRAIELTDDVRYILGFVCFQCINIAQALRLGGYEIKTKAEDEQAASIHFMLNHYLADRENWRENVNTALRAMAAKSQKGAA